MYGVEGLTCQVSELYFRLQNNLWKIMAGSGQQTPIFRTISYSKGFLRTILTISKKKARSIFWPRL